MWGIQFKKDVVNIQEKLIEERILMDFQVGSQSFRFSLSYLISYAEIDSFNATLMETLATIE